jgi:hypothetical protein
VSLYWKKTLPARCQPDPTRPSSRVARKKEWREVSPVVRFSRSFSLLSTRRFFLALWKETSSSHQQHVTPNLQVRRPGNHFSLSLNSQPRLGPLSVPVGGPRPTYEHRDAAEGSPYSTGRLNRRSGFTAAASETTSFEHFSPPLRSIQGNRRAPPCGSKKRPLFSASPLPCLAPLSPSSANKIWFPSWPPCKLCWTGLRSFTRIRRR